MIGRAASGARQILCESDGPHKSAGHAVESYVGVQRPAGRGRGTGNLPVSILGRDAPATAAGTAALGNGYGVAKSRFLGFGPIWRN